MSFWKLGLYFFVICSFFGFASPVMAADSVTGNLTPLWEEIQVCRFVDLIHTFEPGIPHWKGAPDETVETLYSYDPRNGTLGSGFYMQYFSHVIPG